MQWDQLVRKAMKRMGKRSREKKRAAKLLQQVSEAKSVDTTGKANPAADNWVWHKKCGQFHSGFKKVFKLGEAVVWAGSSTDFEYTSTDWSLAIVCAGATMAPTPNFAISPGARELLGREFNQIEIPWIALGWADGSTPPVSRSEWVALVAAIKKIKGNVAVYCLGGHGRTGTALTILAALGGLIPRDTCPVGWIRNIYCTEAVESTVQVTYITSITGRKVFENGSWFKSYYGSRTYNPQKPLPGFKSDMCPDCMCDPGLISTCPLPDCKEKPKREAQAQTVDYQVNKSAAESAQVFTANVGTGTGTGTVVGIGPSYTPPPTPPRVREFKLVREDGGGALQKPITNAAGDVIGYEYVEQETETDPNAPWNHWGK